MKEPTVDNTPGDGHVDILDLPWAEQRGVWNALGDDSYTEEILPPGARLISRGEDGRQTLWDSNDMQVAKMAAQASLLEAAARDIVQRNSMMGIDQLAPGGALGAARLQAQAKAAQAVRTEVLQSYAKQAASVAQAFSDAFNKLGEVFQSCWDDFNSPEVLRDGADVSVQTLVAEEALTKEMESKPNAMAEARALFRRIVRGGDERKLRLFIPAARKAALKVRDNPSPRARGRDNIVSEREHAWRLLQELENYHTANRPPSLDAAANLLGVARQYAQAVFGSMPAASWPGEYEIRGLPGHKADSAKAWNLDREWVGRYLPGARGSLVLPGWSPVVYRGSQSGIGREPKS